jgi:hypothetical protein
MPDYSRALKQLEWVPTLYPTSSWADYYDWKDAMEYFLVDCLLEPHMQLYFARMTFSDDVLTWWRKLHKGLMMRGEEPCRT